MTSKLKRIIKDGIKKTDSLVSRAALRLGFEKDGLLVFGFHAVFNNRNDADDAVIRISPGKAVEVGDLDYFIRHFKEHGYKFISPWEPGGLEPKGRYAMLTFDDGYYNNVLTLPVLEKNNVPAVFFVTTFNVIENKSFWWDVVFRERKKEGKTAREISDEEILLKSKTFRERDSYLRERFEPKAFNPISDIDRPFTDNELKSFSKHPLVHIGNHTHNHAILTNEEDDVIGMEIEECQKNIQMITGTIPNSIAYPDGRFSERVIKATRNKDLSFGFTVEQEKNNVPLVNNLRISRFIPAGSEIEEQCIKSRSDVRFNPI